MPRPHHIAIIGSGTSGLAAAAFLKKDGHRVTILERFDAPQPLGAGLLIQPTGLAALACLELDDAALATGARIHNLYGKDASGHVVFDLDYRDLRPHLFGLGIHRGGLFNLLHAEVLRLEIPIHTGCDIQDSRMEGHSRYLLDTRGEYHGPFDLVVDASGARSALRAKHGNISYHRAYPFGAVWGVCADEEQRFCTDYLQQRYDGAGVMIGMLAIGKRPLDDKQAATFFWSLPTATYATWREDGLAPWKKRVLDYWPELAPFLDQFGSVDDLTFAQYSDTILKHWHDDRMVFIGDAAHCTSPQLGQGANLGLLDALSLALCLRETPEDINAALRCHSKARKSHVHFYQFASRWLTPFFQSDSKAAAWLRNRSFNSMGKIPLVKPQMLYTLAGLKNGLFTHLDPGQWHPRYALKPRLPQA